MVVLFSGILAAWSGLRSDLAGWLTPGEDTQFKCDPPLGTPAKSFVLSHRAGDLSCILHLHFQVAGGAARVFRAVLDRNKVDVELEEVTPRHIEMAFTGPQHAKFIWQADDPLTVSVNQPGVSLRAWRISAKDAHYCDDSSRASLRKVVRSVPAVLFIALVCVFALQFAFAPKNDPLIGAPLGPAARTRLLSLLIGEIRGENAAETKGMQAVLTRILIDNDPPAIACKSLPPRRRWPVLRKAKILLDHQAQGSVASLAEVQKWASKN